MLIYSANTFYQVDKRKPLSFDEEVSENETSKVRIIGITIEYMVAIKDAQIIATNLTNP